MQVTDPIFIFGGAVISALATAVAYLFADFRATRNKVENELGECQKDRIELWKRISVLEKSMECGKYSLHSVKPKEQREQA